MRMKRGLTGLLSVALMFGQNGKQKAAPKAADDLSRITVDVTRVNLLYTVTDKKGRFVSNLTRDDFEIIENKKQQKILEFTAETDLPLRLAILIDTSNSIRERFRFIQEAAINFVTTVMRPGKDRALVVSFDTSPELVSDLTEDQVAVTKAIRDLRPGGGTALYDAIFFSCRDVLMKDQPRDKFRRALVVLSDGEDNQSRWTREQALEMAHKADAVIYTISTNITHLETSGDKVLKRYAEETGGIAFFPFKAEDMGQSFENIANELRHQYNIFYRPDPLKTDGLYHAVDLRVKGRKDLVVRARKGYYAPKM
jgi:Ca-activated chloride channel family protein